MRYGLMVLALVAGTGLAAQQARVNGGAQVGLGLPTGDFADKRAAGGEYLGANGGFGLHVGGHLDLNFGAHHQLHFHVTVHGFASQEQELGSANGYGATTVQNAFGVLQLGGDYVFHVESPSRGLYFLGGLSLNQVTAKTTYSDAPDWEAKQGGRGGLRVGLGYTFNRVFGLETTLNHVALDNTGPDRTGLDALSWLSVTAVFRFGRP